MAKKKVKASVKKVSSNPHHESNAKAIISLMVLLLSFSVLYLFYKYQDNILYSSSFQLFMVLTVVGFGLLVGLLFLINKPQK